MALVAASKPGMELETRTKQFALRVIRLCSTVGQAGPGGVLSRQLLRSGTSVGAQYREARRARSKAEFLSKLQSATQELSESVYWLELLGESGLMSQTKLAALHAEAVELLKIFMASRVTAQHGKSPTSVTRSSL